MENETKKLSTTPPKMMGAFVAGFNTVATHLYLILFPILFDALLWFGPHIRLKNLLLPATEDFFEKLGAAPATSDMNQILASSKEIWLTVLERFNLVSFLRSFPVGIFNLMGSINPAQNPVGKPLIYEISSVSQLFTLWLALALIGILLGSFFFNQVARCCSKIDFGSSLQRLGSEALQAILLSLILILLLALLSIPSSILISIMAMLNVILAQGVLILILLILIWLLFPLFFSPHGIFYYHQKALQAMLSSARVVRNTLPVSTLFILLVILLSEGLNTIWTIPPETSWMMLIGVIGHGFTSTGLLASTFIFFRNNYQWLQENAKNLSDHRVNA